MASLPGAFTSPPSASAVIGLLLLLVTASSLAAAQVLPLRPTHPTPAPGAPAAAAQRKLLSAPPLEAAAAAVPGLSLPGPTAAARVPLLLEDFGIAHTKLYLRVNLTRSRASAPGRSVRYGVSVVLSVYLRALRVPNNNTVTTKEGRAPRYLTRVHGLVWVDHVDRLEVEHRFGHMMSMPAPLQRAHWVPRLLMHHPTDQRRTYALPVADEAVGEDAFVKGFGSMLPWPIVATLPTKIDSLWVSERTKPAHMAEVGLPLITRACPVPETYRGRPAVYMMIKPYRKPRWSRGSDRLLGMADYLSMLTLHMEHHLRLGFAGYIIYVTPTQVSVMRAHKKLMSYVAAGYATLLLWSDQPTYYATNLNNRQFDQRITNNLVGLALSFCGEGVRFAPIDLDEYLVLPDGPAASIQTIYGECLQDTGAAVLYRRLDVFVGGVPCGGSSSSASDGRASTSSSTSSSRRLSGRSSGGSSSSASDGRDLAARGTAADGPSVGAESGGDEPDHRERHLAQTGVSYKQPDAAAAAAIAAAAAAAAGAASSSAAAAKRPSCEVPPPRLGEAEPAMWRSLLQAWSSAPLGAGAAQPESTAESTAPLGTAACHPLCYYGSSMTHTLRGSRVRTKLISAGGGATAPGEAFPMYHVHTSVIGRSVRSWELSERCGFFAHLNNMVYERVPALARGPHNAQPFANRMYRPGSDACRGCPSIASYLTATGGGA